MSRRKKTVLVLGAGASKACGFPTGRELRDMICNQLLPGKNGEIRQLLKGVSDWPPMTGGIRCIEKFAEALSRSSRPSVDEFLEHHEDFCEVGKYAIAAALLLQEDEQRFFGTTEDVKRGSAEGEWYSYFFGRLGGSLDTFATDVDLAIITFNYDRSLEHWLMNALCNTYGKAESECAEAMKRIPIVHVHGQLGYLPWQAPNADESVPYRAGVSPEDISIAARCLRIVHEGAEHDEGFVAARKALGGATRVRFIGFGYHPVNIERLRLPDRMAASDAHIGGTTFGLTAPEIRIHERRLSELWKEADVPASTIYLDENGRPAKEYIREDVHLCRLAHSL